MPFFGLLVYHQAIKIGPEVHIGHAMVANAWASLLTNLATYGTNF